MNIKTLCMWCGKDAERNITAESEAITPPTGWYMEIKQDWRIVGVELSPEIKIRFFCSSEHASQWQRDRNQ
jgi:hypothetical protein